MNEQEDWDFIIIGAGICGLSLGGLLCNDNKRVLILEKASEIGGRARVSEKGGYILDYGIHTVRFGKRSSLAKTLKSIKDKQQDSIEFKELGTSYFYLEEGNPHWEVLPTGLTGITKGDYFNISKLKNVLFKMLMSKKEKNLEISVSQWQDRKKLNDQGKIYLRLITASMQVCPFLDRASMGELRRNLAEVIKKRISVSYPIGGWKLIFNRIINKITNSKGKILTNCPVDKILIEEKKAVGVISNQIEYRAKNILISVPVQEIFSFLDEKSCDSEFVQLCKNLKPTGGLSLDIGLKKKISDGMGVFYLDDPLSFGFFTSNIERGSAPEGKQLFTVCSPQDVEKLHNKAFGNDVLARLREKLFKAFPEMEENIEFERPLFTIFDGVEVNTEQYMERRPPFQIPNMENLYLVGDSTQARGAGGDIGHNSVWDVYELLIINNRLN